MKWRRSGMTTTISSSDSGRFFELYRNILRRNRGYLWLYSALVAVCYPLLYALEAFKSVDPAEIAELQARMPELLAGNPMYFYSFEGLGRNFAGVSIVFFTMIALLAPMILALVLNSYMHSKKASDVYHAIPISRGMLLTANAAVGVTIIGLPLLASNLFIAVVQIVKFGFMPNVFGYLWLDALGWMVCGFAIYAVTTFVSVCVGTVFDSFVLSGTLLLAAPILSALGLTVTEMFLFGWQSTADTLSFIVRLSPVTLMIERFAVSGGSMRASTAGEILGPNGLLGANVALLVWLLLGLLIFWAAVRVYRRRRTEVAETTTSRGILQVLVKLAGTAVCGVTAGLIACAGDHERTSFILWTALIGALTYAVAETVLNRGFKTLLRSLPLGAAMVGAIVLVSLVPMTGAFGYETRVPAPEDVEQVRVSYTGRYGGDTPVYRVEPDCNPDDGIPSGGAASRYDMVELSSPSDLAAVEAFHRDVVRKRYRPYNGMALEPGEEFVHTGTYITYTLKNGRTLSRRYDGAGTFSIRLLAPLETSPDLLAQTHPAFFNKGKDITKWYVSNAFGGKASEEVWPAADSQALLDAMKADLLEQTADDLLHPSGEFIARVSFTAVLPPEGAERASTGGVFYVTDRTPRTRDFLEKKGVLAGIAPDLGACYAAGITGDGYFTSLESAVRQVIPEHAEFTSNDYGYLKENIEELRRYYAENPEEFAADYGQDGPEIQYSYGGVATARATRAGWGEALFEDRADIEALAKAASASWDITEPAVYANFWFTGEPTGTSVIIPLSRLPEDLRQRIEYPYGVPTE